VLDEKRQAAISGKFGDKSLVAVGSSSSQLVIKMHYRENNAKALAQFEEQK
jgi:hypothetical protein